MTVKNKNKVPENFRFNCSFWFKVTDNLLTLDAEYIWKLTDFSQPEEPHPLTFSIPNFYPMPVKTSESKLFFGDKAPQGLKPADVPKAPEELYSLSPARKIGSMREHHLPKGAHDFLLTTSRHPLVKGYCYLSGFPATLPGVTEISESGDIIDNSSNTCRRAVGC